jgi:hypothetical protein
MFHPAAGCGLETLGRPPMGLHFGHDQILNSEIDTSFVILKERSGRSI